MNGAAYRQIEARATKLAAVVDILSTKREQLTAERERLAAEREQYRKQYPWGRRASSRENRV
jgi:transposase